MKKHKKKKNKNKKKMQMVEEKHDWMQEWKERGRMKPFTEEGIEEAQYAAMFMNHTDEAETTIQVSESKKHVWKWMIGIGIVVIGVIAMTMIIN